MSQLLVSVRSAAEAQAAVRGGADIIDCKDPSNGPLGAPAIADVVAIVASLGRSQQTPPLSLAMGELADCSGSRMRQWNAASFWHRIQFVKVGPYCLPGCDWQEGWIRWRAQIRPTMRVIAVAYADSAPDSSESPDHLLGNAIHVGADGLLLDTWNKKNGDLLSHVNPSRLSAIVERAHQHQMFAAMAGSVRLDQIPTLVDCGADVIAVRGAVCRAGRHSPVQSSAVRALAAAVKQASRNACSESHGF